MHKTDQKKERKRTAQIGILLLLDILIFHAAAAGALLICFQLSPASIPADCWRKFLSYLPVLSVF